MDDRKADILRAVIEEYIATAQPVGSTHVARSSGIGVSSATVRNEMTALEQEGYLQQPHTSAGRIPTDKGYRFYVDGLETPGAPNATRTRVRSFFDKTHGELERMLSDTSRLLSNLTSYAGMVIAPAAEAATVRSVQVVGLSARSALAVLVLSTGTVEKHTIELDQDTDDGAVAAASARLAATLDGVSRSDLPEPATSGDATVDLLVTKVMASLRVEHLGDNEQIFVGGTDRMVANFEAIETVRNVLQILEQQFVVVTLLRDVLDRGDMVSIGGELGVESLAECSLVVAPYEVDGRTVGSIGLLGPTRMDYPQALATVAVVSQRLGQRISEG